MDKVIEIRIALLCGSVAKAALDIVGKDVGVHLYDAMGRDVGIHLYLDDLIKKVDILFNECTAAEKKNPEPLP